MLSFILESHWSTRLVKAVLQEWFSLNHDWLGWSRLFMLRCTRIRLFICFSNGFERADKTEMSQAPQHSRSSEKQATCEDCFACRCICSVISTDLYIGPWSFPFTPACPGQYTHRIFRRWMSTVVDTFQFGLPIDVEVCSPVALLRGLHSLYTPRHGLCSMWSTEPVSCDSVRLGLGLFSNAEFVSEEVLAAGYRDPKSWGKRKTINYIPLPLRRCHHQNER